jgi:outer membrane protein assembly factor BamA
MAFPLTSAAACGVPAVAHGAKRTRRRRSGSRAAILVLAALGTHCASIPERRLALDSIDIVGNHELDDSEIEEHIASRATPRFFGLFKGLIYDYEVFDRYVLERDLQRIERYYRARGFYWTHVRAGRVMYVNKQEVRVEVVIDEDEPTLIKRLDVTGLEGVPDKFARDARREASRLMEVGDRFEEERFELSAQALERSLANRGYAYVKVTRKADVDLRRHSASITYQVDAGPLTRLGTVRLSGLGPIPEAQIRRTLGLKRGELYSQEELESAEQALLDLGVFSSVSVRPRLEQDEPDKPVAGAPAPANGDVPAPAKGDAPANGDVPAPANGDVPANGDEPANGADTTQANAAAASETTANAAPATGPTGTPETSSAAPSGATSSAAVAEGDVAKDPSLAPGDVAELRETSEQSAERRDVKRPADASPEVPIDVELQLSRFKSLHLGGGLQLDSQRTDIHLIAGWEHRNLFGGLRYFVVELVPGAVLYPTRLPDLESPERLLPQVRLRSEFRQPGFLEARTGGVVRAQGSIYPVLLSSDRDPNAPVYGYRDVRLAAGLERSLFWKLYGSLTHNIQINDPFTYVGDPDPDLGTALVSYPELFLRLDLRNDRLEPTRGAYVENTLQVAGVGGDARDIKVQPDARGYVPLGHGLTLSARGSIGFLFADNYGQTIAPNAINNDPGTDDRALWVKDTQLMFLRGFFAGGPGSNRGYGLREIGPHGRVPFYNPGQSSEESMGLCDPTMGDISPNCDLPLGGFTLYEASVELRFPLFGPLRGALFTDAADVSPYKVDFRFDHPHLSAGFGFRYGTPVGPVRLDIGYRLPGLQAPDSADEYKPDELFGLPIAISFGIGEPF